MFNIVVIFNGNVFGGVWGWGKWGNIIFLLIIGDFLINCVEYGWVFEFVLVDFYIVLSNKVIIIKKVFFNED